ncbi:MAG: M20/M25/M40 family metallo-hydrolase [Melioribacteraceae bacterium]|nr:M20/M25/M40 family metallo-hydrolase [Melioribacteraceae bacterium]MCF8263769.1 M20/M25/M40 family metallo-hydrolase [Melioribacteraceae bacterium]
MNKERLLNTFLELTKIDGIHGKESAIAEFLHAKLKELNCSVVIDEAGQSFGGNSGNIIGYKEGDPNLSPIFLCAHMDTIKSTKNIKHSITNGIIETDGNTILGGDDRAGIAVILEVLEILNEEKIKHCPLEIVFTVCEEAGMFGAKFIKKENLKSKFGYVFDCQASPGNYIVEAPGASSFIATFMGKSSHAAVSPELGINAISMAGKGIANLKLGRWGETGMMNIGKIEGGVAINVVPDSVVVEGETRNSDNIKLNEQLEYISKNFSDAADELNGKVIFKVTSKYKGYKFEGEEEFVTAAREAIKTAGLLPKGISYPGGSDANIFNSNGIDALNMGVGFKNAHSLNEKIAENDLYKIAEIALNLVEYFSKSVSISE